MALRLHETVDAHSSYCAHVCTHVCAHIYTHAQTHAYTHIHARVSARLSYGPIQLWPYLVMALCSYGPT